MTLRQKQSKFAQMVAKLITWVSILLPSENGYEVTLGEAFRPDFVQERYLKEGSTKVKRSKHQDRLAIDLNLFIDGKYQTSSEAYKPLGEYWKDMGGIWGGDWGWDGNHFEFGEK